jgi:hypothetical protein
MGAYGLRVGSSLANETDSAPFAKHLVKAGKHWPHWTIEWEALRAGQIPESELWSWSETYFRLPIRPAGFATIDREATRTILHLPKAPLPEALIHPHLASTAIATNHWSGGASFHAGSFLLDGRAWGVVGDRGMGKSSLLMWLHRAGFTILSDDVLVVNNAFAYAGPRCLDLRREAAERFEEGKYLGVVGTRERWRVTLGGVPTEVPMGGWVRLEWSDSLSIERAAVSTRVAALAGNYGIIAPRFATPGILDLLDMPMVTFSRPQSWVEIDASMDALVRALEKLS